MWKLTESEFRKFHLAYLYAVLILIIVPLFIHILVDKSLSTLIHGGGYGILFMLLGYPLILGVYLILHAFVHWLKMKFSKGIGVIIYLLAVFGIVYLYVSFFYNFSMEGEEIAYTTTYFSIILFIGYLNFTE